MASTEGGQISQWVCCGRDCEAWHYRIRLHGVGTGWGMGAFRISRQTLLWKLLFCTATIRHQIRVKLVRGPSMPVTMCLGRKKQREDPLSVPPHQPQPSFVPAAT